MVKGDFRYMIQALQKIKFPFQKGALDAIPISVSTLVFGANAASKALITGGAQVAKDEEVRKLLEKGKNMLKL